jgi:predicted Zn-dependent protease
VRETLGAALLKSGRAAAAEAVFRDDLSRNPRNPRSLLGLAKSLEAQNRDEGGNASTAADNALHDADVPVTLADL